MTKIDFNKKRLETLIDKVFPEAKIKTFKKFSTGLNSPVLMVTTTNPEKNVVIKIAKLKNQAKIHKNNLVLKFLRKEKFPVPEVFLEEVFLKKFITVMSHCTGTVASDVYKKGNQKIREKILFNAGKQLKKIHSLRIRSFWVSQKHEIKNKTEWKKWTQQRINKYLSFFEKKLDRDYDFIKTELDDFWDILKKDKIDFVPLHWDYHLSNLNADKNGKITGIFDFDGAMKGHSLADIGISAYFLRFFIKDYNNFNFLLSGYKKTFTKKELRIIRGYFLLQLLAVSRSIWFKKDLRWIIDEHKTILNEFKENII